MLRNIAKVRKIEYFDKRRRTNDVKDNSTVIHGKIVMSLKFSLFHFNEIKFNVKRNNNNNDENKRVYEYAAIIHKLINICIHKYSDADENRLRKRVEHSIYSKNHLNEINKIQFDRKVT